MMAGPNESLKVSVDFDVTGREDMAAAAEEYERIRAKLAQERAERTGGVEFADTQAGRDAAAAREDRANATGGGKNVDNGATTGGGAGGGGAGGGNRVADGLTATEVRDGRKEKKDGGDDGPSAARESPPPLVLNTLLNALAVRRDQQQQRAVDATAQQQAVASPTGRDTIRETILASEQERLAVVRTSLEIERQRNEVIRSPQGQAIAGEQGRATAQADSVRRNTELRQSIATGTAANEFRGSKEGVESRREEVQLVRQLAEAQAVASAATRIRDLQDAVVVERERAKFAGSPAGVEARRREATLTREVAAAQRAAQWKERVAEQGMLGAALGVASERAQAFAAGLAPLGAVMSNVWQQGTQGILGMVSAANPSAFSTFGASMTMLSIEVGKAFVPAVEWASAALQTASRWVAGLDEGLKSTVARVAIGGVAFAGLAVGAMKIWSGFQMAGTAVLGFGRLLTLGMGPVGLAITGLVGAVTYLSGAWDKVTASVQGAVSGMSQAGRVQVGAGPGGQPQKYKDFSPAEVEHLPAPYRDRLRDLSAESVKAATLPADQRKREEERIEAARQQTLGSLEKDTPAWVRSLPDEFRNRLSRPNITADESRNVLRDLERKTQVEIDTIRGGQLPAAAKEESRRIRRQEIIDAELPALQAEFASRKQAFEARVGTGPNAPSPGLGDPEFKGLATLMRAARERAIQKATAEGIGMTEDESKTLLPYSPGNAPATGKMPSRMPGQNTSDVLQRLEAKLSVFKSFAERMGGGPGGQSGPGGASGGGNGMVENIVMPFQSRYSTFQAYQESIQLKALERNDADKVNQQKQMETALAKLGDVQKALDAVVSNTRLLQAINQVFNGGSP